MLVQEYYSLCNCSLGVDRDNLLPITKYDEKKVLSIFPFQIGADFFPQAMTMLMRTDLVLPAPWR